MALRRVGKDLFDDDTAETVAEEYDRSCFLLSKVRFLFYPLTKMMKSHLRSSRLNKSIQQLLSTITDASLRCRPHIVRLIAERHDPCIGHNVWQEFLQPDDFRLAWWWIRGCWIRC